MGDMQPLDSAAIRVQIDHLGDSLQSLTAKVDLLVDMTRAVAVLKADSENHRDLTRQIEASLRNECHRLDAEMRTEQSARGQVEKELAQRVDALRYPNPTRFSPQTLADECRYIGKNTAFILRT